MMNSTTPQCSIEKWEIWLAPFRFDDDPECSKVRPVLILENKGKLVVLVAKITTAAPRKNFIGEYSIMDWQHAGLPKPSTLRLSKAIDIDAGILIKKLGKLSDSDIRNVRQLLNIFYFDK